MKSKKLVLQVILFLLLVMVTTPVLAEEIDTNVINVSGQGSVKAAPDRAAVTLGVITEAQTAHQAQSDNAQKVDTAVKALINSGIAESDIKTKNYSLRPNYVYPEKEAPKIVSYIVENNIMITVKNTEQVGNILDVAVKSGVNQVNSINFYVENDQALKVQALQKAVADARAKADVLAAALGKKITGVKSASGSWNTNIPGPIYFSKDMAAGYGSSNSINPGESEIAATADIVYIIE
jgi:uncharacterized protein YggE